MKNNINIIKTKLIMPAPRKNYIKRKHLLEKLNDIADHKVTLIKGIAGVVKRLQSLFMQVKIIYKM